MIFQHTHEWITGVSPHTGQPKTQTRRLAVGLVPHIAEHTQRVLGIHVVVGLYIIKVTKNGRTLWQLNNDYAVQPGRGRKAVGRIQLTNIRLEDVRTITEADAQAEGFADVAGFLEVWRLMHDYPHRHDSIETLAARPSELYFAFVLEFEAR